MRIYRRQPVVGGRAVMGVERSPGSREWTTGHSHSIANTQALLIGKNRALLAGNRPDTDIATVAQQCMITVVLMTWSDEDRFWPGDKAKHAVLAQG